MCYEIFFPCALKMYKLPSVFKISNMRFLSILFLLSNTRLIFSQKVAIALFARNKEYVLPNFFYYLENLNYPKENITLWITSDHNEDNTTQMVKEWIGNMKGKYGHIEAAYMDLPKKYAEEKGPYDWPESRYSHLIKLKNQVLEDAIDSEMDYLLFLDMDNFLTNPETLNFLIKTNKTLVAPMLTSGHYSNFWCALTDEGYYQRTDDYMPMVTQEVRGCFKVPMIHSTVLINLRAANASALAALTFDPKKIPGYNLSKDDIIVFAKSAQYAGLDMHVCNNETFGHLLEPIPTESSLEDVQKYMLELKMDILSRGFEGLRYSKHVNMPKLPPKDNLGFDKLYMINLEKRADRKKRMEICFDELRLNVKYVPGIDGNKLNESYLRSQNISMLPEYRDPYHKRGLTMGEVGCFLSHYQIWKEVLANDYEKILVFEDDIRFEKDFRRKVATMIREPGRLNLNWDLIYLGRKRLVPPEKEKYVRDSDVIVWPEYSYWTISYALSKSGAKKLIEAEPLTKMIPVDEYFPLMFDVHPEEDWKKYFPHRDLVAFSAYPLLVYPTHYTGDKGYISDTEDSPVITAFPVKTSSLVDENGINLPADLGLNEDSKLHREL